MIAFAVPEAAPQLRTKLAEPALVVADFGPVHIVVYERDPEIETIDRAMRFQRELHDSLGRSLSLVTLVKAGLNMPESDVRQHSAKLMRDNASWVNSAAVVVPESGLWTSAVMSVMAGLNLLSRASIPLRMFTDRGKASAWTLTHGDLPMAWQAPLESALADLW